MPRTTRASTGMMPVSSWWARRRCAVLAPDFVPVRVFWPDVAIVLLGGCAPHRDGVRRGYVRSGGAPNRVLVQISPATPLIRLGRRGGGRVQSSAPGATGARATCGRSALGLSTLGLPCAVDRRPCLRAVLARPARLVSARLDGAPRALARG